jgi:hypothetical protein
MLDLWVPNLYQILTLLNIQGQTLNVRYHIRNMAHYLTSIHIQYLLQLVNY